MPSHRSMTRSPLALVREAYRVGQEALPVYSSQRSRHDFTQAQLFAILALRQFFRTDYRGIVQMLADFSEVRRELKLTKLPHFTTLQKAEQRLVKKGVLTLS